MIFRALCSGIPHDCVYPQLLARTGQRVEVIGPLPDDEYHKDETGPMFHVRFDDGYERAVYEVELHDD